MEYPHTFEANVRFLGMVKYGNNGNVKKNSDFQNVLVSSVFRAAS